MTSEKKFENKVKSWFRQLQKEGQPIKFIKIWGGGKYQKAGIPDIIACINGIYFEIELKSSTGQPSDLQKYNLRLTNQANGFGILLYPEGFEEFKKIVKGVLTCSSHIPKLNALKHAHSNISCDILID